VGETELAETPYFRAIVIIGVTHFKLTY